MLQNDWIVFAFGIGLQEMVILGAIGVLLFGKRLPDVGRQLGKGLAEFKKGIHGIESEINSAVDSATYASPSSSSSSYSSYEDDSDDYYQPSAPKFEPPAASSDDASDGGKQ